jgi:hypothetical protein
MSTRFSKHMTVLLLPAAVLVTACGETNHASPTTPAAVSTSALITAEPLTATPEFLPLAFCPAGPPFAIRLLITIGSGGDIVIVRRLRFHFRDRFGDVAVPLVTETRTALSGSIPTQMPIPLPTSPPIAIPSASPIPIPGSLPFEDARIQAGGSRTVPTFLQFGCGVPADGTLVVSVDTAGVRGTSGTSHVSVRIGG